MKDSLTINNWADERYQELRDEIMQYVENGGFTEIEAYRKVCDNSTIGKKYKQDLINFFELREKFPDEFCHNCGDYADSGSCYYCKMD